MQIVIGIDRARDQTAPDLVKRLRFREANFDLTYVVPPVSMGLTGGYGSYGTMPPEAVLMYDDIQALERQEKEQARHILLNVAESFLAEEGTCGTSRLSGNPTEVLLEHAEETGADLIAVNAAHEGPILAFLTGSVARGLVIGASQSVLLARPEPNKKRTVGPVRAVLATDHSPYMETCIEQFIRFHPRGLEHLTLLTSYPGQEMANMSVYLPDLTISPVDAMRHELEERNRRLVTRLTRLREAFGSLPVTIDSRVSGEPVDCAITQTMEDTESNLLILGAQGHSFLERLTLGSVSFKQAMTAPYSVLVLRVGHGEQETIRATSRAMAASS